MSSTQNSSHFSLTFRGNPDPVEVSRQLLRYVCLSSGGKADQYDDSRGVSHVWRPCYENKHTHTSFTFNNSLLSAGQTSVMLSDHHIYTHNSCTQFRCFSCLEISDVHEDFTEGMKLSCCLLTSFPYQLCMRVAWGFLFLINATCFWE